MEAVTSTTQTKPNIDVHSLITDKIIEQLNEGEIPWHKLWDRRPPTNLITQESYTGINALLLGMEEYERNYFISFDQVNGVGGKVKKGSKGHMVARWDKVKNAETGKDDFQIKYTTVFNIAQCEKIPEHLIPVNTLQGKPGTFEVYLDSVPNCPKIKNEGKEAYYDVVEDVIFVPKMRGAKDEQRYYVQLFKQLIHSTGHDSRLARKGVVEMSELASDPLYSKEDLIADIGLCFLLSALGSDAKMKTSISYVTGWITKLKSDNRLVLIAAGQAQKAVDYILNAKKQKQELSETKND